MPVSCLSSGSDLLVNGSLCLEDGSYTLRSIGLCDPLSNNMTWSFCGVSDGGGLEHLEFTIDGGVCTAVQRLSAPAVCSGSRVPSGIPSGAPIGWPTATPSAGPTALGTVVLTNELTCSNECAVSVDALGLGADDDTCLFVTLMDQFGDGWGDGTSFSYWSEIRDDVSNVVSTSLDCGCPRMSGCIRPSELNVDQLLHMTAVSVDESSGEVRVPEYFWEVYWTVQVVERGEWKNKYYGGYNTSLTFEYSPSLGTFEAVSLENVWKPEVDMSCDVSSITDSESFWASRLFDVDSSGRPYSYANETSTYVEGGGGGYHESVWVVTDSTVSDTLSLLYERERIV